MYYESNYLSHYGVLGMKWGVRRYQNKDGSLTSEGKKRTKKANTSLIKTVDRTGLNTIKHPINSSKTIFKMDLEAFKHPIDSIKLNMKNVKLITKYKKEYMRVVNKKFDELNNDFGNLEIEKTFLKKYSNYTVEEILNDEDAAVMAWLLFLQ